MVLEREKSAGYMTNWAARLFAREIDRRLKPHGLSSGHLPVFFALGGGAALTQKQLAKVAAIEQPTMAATLSRMERDGLITRNPNPQDRRSALVSLTPMALEKTQAVAEATSAVNAEVLAGLAEPDRERFLEMLRNVVTNLEKEAQG